MEKVALIGPLNAHVFVNEDKELVVVLDTIESVLPSFEGEPNARRAVDLVVVHGFRPYLVVDGSAFTNRLPSNTLEWFENASGTMLLAEFKDNQIHSVHEFDLSIKKS